MGARFLGVGLAGSVGWYALHHDAQTAWEACWRTLLVSFAAAVVGKIVGLAWYRLRHRRSIDELVGNGGASRARRRR